MFFHQKSFVIKESKNTNIARFFLSYQSALPSPNHVDENKQKSYHLLSLLKQQNDVILEIDSELTTLPSHKESESVIQTLVKDLTDMDIDFRLQKSEAKSTKSIFGIFGSNATHTAYRLLAYIPDAVWRESLFQMILPTFGVRYYICKGQADAQKLLEDLYCGKILAVDLTAIFDYVIYDSCDFSQMGINTVLSKEAIQKQLTAE
jgi:hypothetical protein